MTLVNSFQALTDVRKNSTGWYMPKYRLLLIRIFPYMDRIISVFSSTGTESPIKSKYRKIQIRKSPNFITFHSVINFVCCGGPRNVFVMSTSRFFPKPIGVIHIWGPLWGEVVKGKNEMLSDLGGGGRECSERAIAFYYYYCYY